MLNLKQLSQNGGTTQLRMIEKIVTLTYNGGEKRTRCSVGTMCLYCCHFIFRMLESV